MSATRIQVCGLIGCIVQQVGACKLGILLCTTVKAEQQDFVRYLSVVLAAEVRNVSPVYALMPNEPLRYLSFTYCCIIISS